MKITCDQCQKQYQIADEKIGPNGAKIKCKNCGNTIIIKPQGDNSFNEDSASEVEGEDAAAAGGEWYASLVSGEQVGPVSLSQIESYWDNMQLTEESLCWKAGMGDWLALAEIPELAFLAIHKAHPKQNVESSAPAAATASQNSYGQAPAGDSFGTDNGSSANVDWKPAGASDLSALVKEEMAANKRAEEEAKKAAEAAAAGPAAPAALAGLFGNEGTNPGNNSYGAAPAGADPFAAPASDPFAQKPQSAQAYNNYGPAPTKSSNTGLIVIIVVLLMVLAGGGLWAAGIIKIGDQQQQVAANTAPAAAAPAAPQAVATAPAAATQEEAAAPAAAAPAAASNDNSAAKETKSAPAKKETKSAPAKKETKAAPAKKETAKPAAPAAPAAPKCDKQKLEGADIQSVVKARLPGAVKGCYPAAKQRGDISGPVQAEFSFTVEPSGKVSAPSVGPASLANTGFAECVKNDMRKWRFPSFCEGGAKKIPPIKMGLK